MPEPTTVQLKSTDGVDLALHDFGGTGPTIVFAHATGFHGRVWGPVIESLTDRFRCVALDFRGHGDSTPPDHGSFAWAGFGDDIETVIDSLEPRLGIDQGEGLYGVGHSKGGAALLLAEQRRPATFTALFCFEPIVLDPERRAAAAAMGEPALAIGARRRREVFASRDEAYANYAAKPPLDTIDPRALRSYVDHGFVDLDDGTVQLKCRGANEAATYANSTGHAAFDHLHQVTIPVTVAAGATIEHSPASFAPAVAEALPHGTFEQHDHLGHFGPLEAPEFIANRIAHAFGTQSHP